jgi:POT family proton-dependent oligopeptide transporter
MLIGLLTYVAGFRYLPADRPRTQSVPAEASMNRRQWRIVVALAVVSAITIFQSIGYYQNTNLGLVWINHSVNLEVLGFHVPVAWFSSIDPLASILAVPLLLALWRRQAALGNEPDDLGKIATGAWLTAAANLVLVAACMISPRTSLVVPLLYDTLLGIAFLYYWPTLLALVSRAAPAQIKATLMGAVFLTLFVGNLVIGWLGSFYERMTPAAFWAMHAGIAALGGVLASGLKRPLKRALALD